MVAAAAGASGSVLHVVVVRVLLVSIGDHHGVVFAVCGLVSPRIHGMQASYLYFNWRK